MSVAPHNRDEAEHCCAIGTLRIPDARIAEACFADRLRRTGHGIAVDVHARAERAGLHQPDARERAVWQADQDFRLARHTPAHRVSKLVKGSAATAREASGSAVWLAAHERFRAVTDTRASPSHIRTGMIRTVIPSRVRMVEMGVILRRPETMGRSQVV